jgi:hypothetical protein
MDAQTLALMMLPSDMATGVSWKCSHCGAVEIQAYIGTHPLIMRPSGDWQFIGGLAGSGPTASWVCPKHKIVVVDAEL